jgi:carbon monoxide dehydrogenase subunit G
VDIPIQADKRFHVRASSAEAFALLADVPRSVSHYPGVESLEDQGDGVFLWKLEKMGTAGISHQIIYACRYVGDPDAGTVTWTPEVGVGNAVISGTWTLSEDSEGTWVTFHNQGVLSIPIPRLLKSAALPFVRSSFSSQIERYLENLVVSLGKSEGSQ